MSENTISLAAFAAAESPQRRCLLCNVDLSIEEQARQGKESGVSFRLICKWLESLGHEHVTKGRLEKHFYDSHIHPNRTDV